MAGTRWVVLLLFSSIGCEARRLTQKQNASALESVQIDPLSVSLTFLALKIFENAPMIIRGAYMGKNVRDQVQAVHTAWSEDRDFLDHANTAMSEFDNLILNSAKTGVTHTLAVLRSQYMQLKGLRAQFQYIDSYCERGMGFIHWIGRKEGSKELQHNISRRVAELDAFLDDFTDTLFCPHFESQLQDELQRLMFVILEWEEERQQTWKPLRKVPDTLLSNAGASAAISATLKDVYGLTDEELEQVQATKWVDWAYLNNLEYNQQQQLSTTFPDLLLADNGTSIETKARYQTADREVALIFAEMRQMTQQCSKRAQHLFDVAPYCQRCPSCCRYKQESPSLWQRMQRTLGVNMDTLQKWYLTMFDASSIVSAATGNVGSILWLLQRMATRKGDRFQRCQEALDLMLGLPSSAKDQLGHEEQAFDELPEVDVKDVPMQLDDDKQLQE